ncbi:DUF871 domain-containing protein [Heyndrickxia sporothermodurans]|uniref:DUF871 domain-containing protein n=1 Tax=Heyndrickxia sporothermodurans TaxID=46224 RepID=UPI002E240443
MVRLLGISVYLSEPIENQREYIQKLSDKGFQSIFTSLHIPEDNPDLFKGRLIELGAIAKQNNMELIADISPKSLHYLGYTWETADQLLTWGLTGLRIDYGVEENIIAQQSNKMKIALNASTSTEESLNRLKSYGLNTSSVEAWHNFYPRPETGLAREEFHEQNQWLKSEGLKVMAFIPGDKKRRGPLFKGLPTLEDHRALSPFVAFCDLKFKEKVDKILVGDFELSDFVLEQFSALHRDGYFLIRAKSYTENKEMLNVFEKIQTNRLDSARDCIRSMESREYGLIGTNPVEPFHTIKRSIGSITVDNKNYGRYQGEIQITKTSLDEDEKVNVIGRVIEEDIPLLKYIKGGKKFKICWI